VPKETFPRDRFDEVPSQRGRVGAHRAENPRMRAGVVVLWAAAATLVLVAAGVFGTLIASGRIDLTPAATPTATPEPTVTPVLDTSYSVLVLNATPVEGLSGQIADKILAAGWSQSNVLSGGAGSNDFRTTTVYYLHPEDEAAAAALAQVIGGADIVENADLEGAVEKQLRVVIGLDRVATPSPAPSS